MVVFWLSVRAEVFVAKAGCDLVVPVATSNHEELFVELWALGECVEFSFVDSAWDDVIACSFGCGLDEEGCLYFEESLLVEVVACGHDNVVSRAEAVLHFWSAKVEVAVFESVVFACVYSVVYFKWGHV